MVCCTGGFQLTGFSIMRHRKILEDLLVRRVEICAAPPRVVMTHSVPRGVEFYFS